MMNDNYLVATNFYHSHPELGGYPSGRYETAVYMLENSNEISVQLFGSILSATHQSGDYPTQYSNIYDLKNRIIYLFHFHNFEEYMTLDLKEELKKESRSYYLQDLFSKIHMIYPKQINIVNPSSVTFKWEGKKTSEYYLYYSTDPNFAESEPVYVAMNHSWNHKGTLYSAILLGITLLGGIRKQRRRSYLFILFVFVILFISFNCSDEITAPPYTENNEISITIENLESNMTYFWKVVAYPLDYNEYCSESTVQTFKTKE
jgi:hypothetical protein